ncbi:MAG: PKD domain-containing protein, partial [Bacteroidota bacterium]
MRRLFEKISLMAAALAMLTIAACTDDEPEVLTPDPVANFSFQVDNSTGTVTFTNTSEDATSYSWNFGDGTTSEEIAPTKVYPTGTYTVTLTATNDVGASDTFEDEVTILIPLQVTLPINFEDANTIYDASGFLGASFSVVPNPAPGGSNDKTGNVGQITNSGAASEGLFWDLGEA